jgi:hypothetical protein
MLFATVTHLAEGLSLETLLALQVEKSLICLVGTRRPTVCTLRVEQKLILLVKFISNTRSLAPMESQPRV